jgi:DNA processing protein
MNSENLGTSFGYPAAAARRIYSAEMSSALASSLPAISPLLEMGSYEALWAEKGASFKTVAERFRTHPDSLPSDFVMSTIAEDFGKRALSILTKAGVTRFGVRVNGAGEYPEKLRDAAHPVELLYYQGWWDLVNSPCVAVVGTREPSDEGKRRAEKITKSLVQDGFTVVSGLAKGIDAIAHRTAIESAGRTIAVIGTPLSHSYPKENKELQQEIAEDFLLLSQVPVYRYSTQDWRVNRLFFPERNITMSALTLGTVIVEAGETSGTLVQARAAIHQGRKLFILDSCFNKPGLTWPSRFEKLGAIRVRDYEDVRRHLGNKTHQG